MPLQLTTTSGLQSNVGVNAALCGGPNIGKTVALRTLPGRSLIVDLEGGQLSNAAYDLPAVKVQTWDEANELYDRLVSDPQFMQFESIGIDSLSELAEIKLAEEMPHHKNGMQAYGKMGEAVTEWVKKFLRLPQNVIFTCKYGMDRNTGLYGPLFPGLLLNQNLFYWLDEVLIMRFAMNAEGQQQRVIQCQSCPEHEAGDRSGKLDLFENPNLGAIIAKIKNHGVNEQ